jgi:ferredoxin-NADP reductase/MOSC domain-containing protein YiiM
MATLLAVNVGLPKDVAWRGATVHTAVWKKPVSGRRMVRRLNVDGDGQGDLGGHGGEHRAVLVYQIESYRYWQAHFGRDDFEFGQFGENFTVDGLADNEVCIGDRYRIGDAVFEVTQPRVTCYRVGLRMNEPQMAALLVAHRRPGFYLRVLVEGEVGAGDEILKVASDPAGVTVAEIDTLLYLPGHARDRVARAVTIPALSEGWRGSLQALLDRVDGDQAGRGGNPGLSTAGGPPPAWPGFRPLRVVGVDIENVNVTSFRLADLDSRPLPAALPGQFITVRLHPDGEDWLAVVRSYSLSGPPAAGTYRISVKRESGGVASTYLHAQVVTGDILDVAAPRGTFVLQTGQPPVVLASAGVGATPVLAMLHALAAERSTREVWWLHGARNGTEHSFAAEVRSLLAGLPNAHTHICYSQPGAGDRKGHDYASAGRLSAELLRRLDPPPTAEVYLCGPAGFAESLSGSLVSLGFDPSQVHQEIFGSGPALTPGITRSASVPHPPAGPPGSGPVVSFARSGLSAHWDPRYESLLELAEAYSVPTRWSCRTGVCHNCETALLSGGVHYSPEPIDDPAEGNVLICCARPNCPVVLDL